MTTRLFDIIVSAASLALLAAPLAVVALLIKIFDHGPIFFRQPRVGKHGKLFTLYKFRSMREASGGPEVTSAGDARITPIGRFVRRWKIDELPQLWNVLRGDMSIIGPRPEVERYVNHYTEGQREILNSKPGLASVSQLAYANEADLLKNCADPEQTYIQKFIPLKVAKDLEYERQRTFLTDMRLLFEIALFVFGINRRLDRDYVAAIGDSKGLENTDG